MELTDKFQSPSPISHSSIKEKIMYWVFYDFCIATKFKRRKTKVKKKKTNVVCVCM